MRKTASLAWGIALLTVVLECMAGLLTVSSRGAAQSALGVPDLLLTLPFVLASAGVGAVLATSRPTNLIGWLLATCGLLVALDAFARAYAIEGLFQRPGSLPAPALVAWVNAWTWQLTLGLMLTLVPLIFPTGRPPSRRWGPIVWIVGACILAWTLGGAFGPGTIYLDWRSDYTIANPLGQALLADSSLVLDGRRAGPPIAIAASVSAAALLTRLIGARGEERRQLKWIALAAGISAAGVLVTAAGAWRVGLFMVAIGVTGLPLAAGIAILRSRLLDIDVVISNAAIYAALTALVAGLCGGVTMLVQRLSIFLLGEQSDATLVVAAVIAAVAFTPVKNRLQARVDQRFKSGPMPAEAAVTELSAEVARLRAKVESV